MLLVWAAASGIATAASSPADLVLVLDASGSMWGQIGGENKISIARRAVKDLLAGLPAGTRVGLVAYGHRSESDCKDIETISALAPLDAAGLGARVEALQPKGKTPITAALEHAFGVARGAGAGAPAAPTVVLVSDGLETCGGDPCAAVAAARRSGNPFVLHVVGFDLGKDDASSLECAAQAGGGLYFDARDAAGLAHALDRVTVVEETPAGRLSVRAIADGKPVDASVHVRDAAGSEVAFGRTYTAKETNPRVLPLADGRYEVEVRPVAIRGAAPRSFDVEIAGGAAVEKVADWSSGELAIKVTRNGALSDATVVIYPSGAREQAAIGRTYAKADSNPKTWRIAAGVYDVEIGSVEIAGRPSHRIESVTVEPGGRAERAHAFVSGTLRIGAVRGAERVDATIGVTNAAGASVGAGRTYTAAATNPQEFVLEPGRYRVRVAPVKADVGKARTIEVEVAADASAEETVDFGG
jgi:Ca-activated chloride channel family protein